MQYKQIDGNRQNLPKSWTLKDGSQTGNFDLLPEEVHNDEGWFQCGDDPIVDTPATHKLGGDTLIGNKWQRAVVEKTQLEIATVSVTRLAELELEIDSVCAGHVAGHIDLVEKAHWMGMADALSRKQSLWVGDQFSDIPDPVLFPPLTEEERTLWSNLAIIQKLTAACRDSAATITDSLYIMSAEEINALPTNWVATHLLWP